MKSISTVSKYANTSPYFSFPKIIQGLNSQGSCNPIKTVFFFRALQMSVFSVTSSKYALVKVREKHSYENFRNEISHRVLSCGVQTDGDRTQNCCSECLCYVSYTAHSPWLRAWLLQLWATGGWHVKFCVGIHLDRAKCRLYYYCVLLIFMHMKTWESLRFHRKI